MITKNGTVTSAKMKGTVTVTVHRSVFHPLYKKRYRSSRKFLADTDGKDLAVGDEVLIGECRPLSKRKHFKVLEITKQAPRVSDIGEEAGLQEAMHRTKDKGLRTEDKGSKESSSSSSASTASTASQP